MKDEGSPTEVLPERREACKKACGAPSSSASHNNVFDTLYYAIYRFGRSIRQPDYQAKACAGTWMPMFFIMAIFCSYCVLGVKWWHGMIPPRHVFLASIIGILMVSYLIYGGRNGRGNRIISEHEKLENQRFYFWLGAGISTLTLSSPVALFFVLRAVM